MGDACAYLEVMGAGVRTMTMGTWPRRKAWKLLGKGHSFGVSGSKMLEGKK